MATSQSKIDTAAKAAANAKAKTDTVDVTAVEQAVDTAKPAPVEADRIAKAVAAKPKSARNAGSTKKVKRAAPATKSVPETASAAKPAKSISKLKETIMATASTVKTTDYTAKAKEMAADMQTRAKNAFDKGTEITRDMVEFQKGNVEALTESGKVLAGGIQDMGRVYMEEAKSAAETVQDDFRKMAAVKSPTELLQLQGEIARRNFDTMVKTTSRNTEAMLKLAGEAFAPLSSRMSLAAEKVGKAA